MNCESNDCKNKAWVGGKCYYHVVFGENNNELE